MKKLLYIHGIGSGENSRTAQILRENLKDFFEIFSPEIPINPNDALTFIWNLCSKENFDIIIGTSLGGFYAMQIGGPFKIIINPAMFPSKDIIKAIGYGEHEFLLERKNKEKTYIVDDEFINQLRHQEKIYYSNILDMEAKYETYALFGKNDEYFSHYEDFKNLLYKNNAKFIDGTHRLTKENIEQYLIPLIKELENK